MHMVSEASALSGLTVRALHHYDAIGLLKPSSRSSAGYRLYSDEDIRTLRRAIRQGDPQAVTETVEAYRDFLESCDWPVEKIGVSYSNLGALMHWERRHELAMEFFVRAEQLHGLDGYGHAWFASASLAAGAPRERVLERLRKAGRRLESGDAMRIFNQDAVLSAEEGSDDLLDALLLATS